MDDDVVMFDSPAVNNDSILEDDAEETIELIRQFQQVEEDVTDDVPGESTQTFTPNVGLSSKPVIGMTFPSIDHAFEFYKGYAKAAGFSVRKGGQWAPNDIVKIKYLVCSKEGKKPSKVYDSLVHIQKGKKVVERKRASIRCGCKASVTLTSEDGETFKIYKFLEDHNHPLVSEDDMHLLASNRQLTYLQEEMIGDLSKLNMGHVKAFNIMRTKYGGFEKVGATSVDCMNFKSGLTKFIGEYDADLLVSTDEDSNLTGLFWADALCKKNYRAFGDVISFDATFNTNRYKMVFVPFTGIDNHYRNVTLGAGLLSSERFDSYKWLLTAFLKSFGRQPNVVVTDQDPAIKLAIDCVFTESRHRLCMWHIMKKVADKVGDGLCNNEDFKQRICDIVWTDSIGPAEFELKWEQLMIDYN